MRKLVIRTTACCVLSTCLVVGATVIGSATTATDLPAGGVAAVLSDYCATDSKLPSAGVTLTLDEYAVSSADTDLINSVSKVSEEYRTIVIAQVDGYVNVRAEAKEDAEVVGKLYNNAAATILEKIDGWYKVTSGNVTGYVKSECVVEGEEAQMVGQAVGNRIATTSADTNIYAAMDSSSQVLFVAEPGETIKVLEEIGDFVRVSYAGAEGYVAKAMVEVTTKFATAETPEEEALRIEAEEAAIKAQQAREAAEAAATQKEAEEAAKKAEQAAKAAEEAAQASGSESAAVAAQEANESAQAAGNAAEQAPESTPSREETPSEETSNESSYNSADSYSDSSKGQQIANYALQFVGNPYAWGGTSLTNGADCSGFVMSVFNDCGIGVAGRTASAQSAGGTSISSSELQPGDLVFYTSGGRVSHVAIYIGDGQIVHAANSRKGIIVSSYNYQTPYKYVRYY